MVFFCCNKCGSSLKKAQVDKHMFQCHTGSFSCMDCQKNFAGDEYKLHTKCISEEEKYAGDGWKAPTNRNKGEKKQMAWFETVQATMENAGKSLMPAARNLLQALTKHENCPRKKPKFLNFVRNVGRNQFDERTIDQVWGLLETQWKSETEKVKQEAEKAKQKAEQQKLAKDTEASPIATAATQEHKKDKKKKKKKGSNETPPEEETAASAPEDRSDSIVETNEEVITNGEEVKVKPKKNKKKRKNPDHCDEDPELVTKKSKQSNGEECLAENSASMDQFNSLEESSSKKSKKQKRKKGDDDESGTIENVNQESVETEETPKKKKKKSKAERVDAREALCGHDDNSLIESNGVAANESSINCSQSELTAKELKAKLKAEKKAARKAAKVNSAV